MTPSDRDQQDREAFEKWYYIPVEGLFNRDEEGEYLHSDCWSRFMAWQAALAYERGKRDGELERLRKNQRWVCNCGADLQGSHCHPNEGCGPPIDQVEEENFHLKNEILKLRKIANQWLPFRLQYTKAQLESYEPSPPATQPQEMNDG